MRYTIAILLITATANAQTHIGLGAGFSSKAPMVLMHVGYMGKNWNVEYDQRAHASNKVNEGAYFGIRTGYSIRKENVTVSIMAGPYYNLQAMDKQELNGWTYGAGITATHKMIYYEIWYNKNLIQAGVKVYGFIRKKC